MKVIFNDLWNKIAVMYDHCQTCNSYTQVVGIDNSNREYNYFTLCQECVVNEKMVSGGTTTMYDDTTLTCNKSNRNCIMCANTQKVFTFNTSDQMYAFCNVCKKCLLSCF